MPRDIWDKIKIVVHAEYTEADCDPKSEIMLAGELLRDRIRAVMDQWNNREGARLNMNAIIQGV